MSRIQAVPREKVPGVHSAATDVRQGCFSLIVVVMLICRPAGTSAGAQADDLISAARDGDLARVQALVASRGEVDAKGRNGATALMAASNNQHVDVVQALLDRGADVNATARDGATALILAAEHG